MPKQRKSLKSPRQKAFKVQQGLCYYCHQPMWSTEPKSFAKRFGLSLSQAQQMQCTGEHLVAHTQGGSALQENIVAACKYCNKHRHQLKITPPPEQFEKYVSRRLSRGKWHGLTLVSG